MRGVIAAIAATLALAGAAWGAAEPSAVRVAKPAFPPPLARQPATGAGPRLRLVSATPRAPAYSPVELDIATLPRDALRHFGGAAGMTRAILQPATALVVYGTGTIAAYGPRGGPKYAFDLRSFGYPPRSLAPRAYGPQEITWARQLGRTLVVQSNHLGYASDSGGRNGYLTGIDLDTGRVKWRSPALVANGRNFVVTRGLIVSGYGFTAERDWLYLVDPRTGRVRDRLELPSAAEQITLRGDRIVVRCYDASVVARLVPS